MESLEEILQAVRRLPEAERRRLIEELRESEPAPPTDEARQTAMREWLAMAGTGHSELTDVSENKNRYLAEIYATKP